MSNSNLDKFGAIVEKLNLMGCPRTVVARLRGGLQGVVLKYMYSKMRTKTRGWQ